MPRLSNPTEADLLRVFDLYPPFHGQFNYVLDAVVFPLSADVLVMTNTFPDIPLPGSLLLTAISLGRLVD